MDTRLPLLVTLAFMAAPAAAQDPYDRDPQIIVRERVRDVIRGHVLVKETLRGYQGRDRGPEQT
jgi:hypothetical protein